MPDEHTAQSQSAYRVSDIRRRRYGQRGTRFADSAWVQLRLQHKRLSHTAQGSNPQKDGEQPFIDTNRQRLDRFTASTAGADIRPVSDVASRIDILALSLIKSANSLHIQKRIF